MIKFRCGSCGKKIGVGDELAGRRVKCPGCSGPVVVPASSDEAAGIPAGIVPPAADRPPARPAAAAAPRPPHSQSSGPRSADAGPTQLSARSASPKSAVPTDSIDALAAFDLAAPEEPAPLRAAPASAARSAPAGGRTCPGCHSPVKQDAVICVKCGRHLKLGVNAKTAMRAQFLGKAGMGVVGACVGGLLGAVIWAGIVYATGYEIGWIAWGVGILSGLGVALMTEERSPRMGLAAVAVAIVAMSAGKLLAVHWSVGAIAQEIREDENLMAGVVFDEMLQKKEFPAEIQTDVEKFLALDEMDPESIQITDAEYERLEASYYKAIDIAAERARQMPEETKTAIADQRVSETLDQMPFWLLLVSSSSWRDLLWFGLAIGSAWKLGAGSGSNR